MFHTFGGMRQDTNKYGFLEIRVRVEVRAVRRTTIFPSFSLQVQVWINSFMVPTTSQVHNKSYLVIDRGAQAFSSHDQQPGPYPGLVGLRLIQFGRLSGNKNTKFAIIIKTDDMRDSL